MFKRLLAALNPPDPVRAPRKSVPAKSLAELEAELSAELDAAGASVRTEAQRRDFLRRRLQAHALSDAETVAALVRSWLIQGRD